MRKPSRAALVLIGLTLAPTLLFSRSPASGASSRSQPTDLAERAEASGSLPLIVSIDAPAEAPAVAEVARRSRGEGVRTFSRLPNVTLTGTPETIRALAADPRVVSITEDVPLPPLLDSTLPVVSADDTRALGFGGAGTTVAIIDTGIDADHPFFMDNNGGRPGTSRILAQACFSHDDPGSNRFTLCPNGTTSDLTDANVDGLAACANLGCPHGSHVAGIAAGDGAGVAGAPLAGVAPDAGIIAIQVFTRFTSTTDCDPTPAPCVLSFRGDQMAALDHVLTLATANPAWGVVAANMSLGGGPPNVTACDGDTLKPAVDNLLAAGIATAVAAGNDGLLDGVSAPGCISTAITVGSTTDADGVSDFSNRGPLLDLLAPGSGVDSSVINRFGRRNGTSMAAPHVTGALAVLKQANRDDLDRTIDQLLDDLRVTGVPVTYAIDTTGTATVTTPRMDVLAAAKADPVFVCRVEPASPPPGAIVVSAGVATTGTVGDDVIYGTLGADTINGGGGNDTIFGRGGADRLNGDAGDDTLCGGGGKDAIVGGTGADVLSDADNDDLQGSGGDDHLAGGLGADRLRGGPGTDTCVGGGESGDRLAKCEL